jgi:hypothetical protein
MKKLLLALAGVALMSSCKTYTSIGTTEGIRETMDEAFILEDVDAMGNEWYWSEEFQTEQVNYVTLNKNNVMCITYFAPTSLAAAVYHMLDDSTYQCYGNYCIGKYDMFIFIDGVIFDEDYSMIVQQPLMRKRFINFDKYKK